MKRTFIGAIICLLSVAMLAFSGSASQPQNPAGQNQATQDAIALREAFRRGGLREVAKLKGHYVGEYDPHWDLLLSLETLTKDSAAVIVGRFTKKLDARIPDSRVIFTDYQVAVEELIKGDIKQSETVVTLPGGRIVFEDGTSAEQLTPYFDQPRIGRAYTLFLMREKAVPGVFFLFGGPEGMFDIEDSAGVRSHGRADDPAAVETKGMSRELFLRKVREQERK